ncbi:hypothetical protein bAD24_III11965 [Burkholderia sp. AD24]|nr:hypothetical protein bAD24_III11965 [Burkholderia sp. AD24]
MEELAERIRVNILAMDPKQLIGYLWSLALRATNEDDEPGQKPAERIQVVQLALEYFHATLSCFMPAHEEGAMERKNADELLKLCREMLAASRYFAVVSTPRNGTGVYGAATPKVELYAKTSWVSLRGHRYQVLEGEFFRFALAPHEAALREAYGVGATDIAEGLQKITLSMMLGQGKAVEELGEGAARADALIAEHGISYEDAAERLRELDPEMLERAQAATIDMFWGGICNLSTKTNLPEALLEDLAFERGANTEFFAPGAFCGTPYRTLPARVRPAVKLDDGYYAIDVSFIRDSAYRAIQWGLQARLPADRQRWKVAQQRMSEDAFEQIFASQLRGARVFKEVYYQHPETGRWVENDVLILIDDVLVQLEAKAGAMPMHGPATNFTNHVRAVQQLVTDAYEQSKRFFEYAASAAVVPLFRLHEGRYEEVIRLRLADYRVCIPIGLTVEAFTPFSAMCKELPEVEPILGLHPFVSLSIDVLFVITKLLPRSGELFHYLSVRQQAAGIRNAMVFDEIDHLGFYAKNSRFGDKLRRFRLEADEVVMNGLSDVIDQHFTDDGWAQRDRPTLRAPAEFSGLCAAVDDARKEGWLRAQAYLLDFDAAERTMLGGLLRELSPEVARNAERLAMFTVREQPTALLLRLEGMPDSSNDLARQAEAFSIGCGEVAVQCFVVTYNRALEIVDAYGQVISAPPIASESRRQAEERSIDMMARVQPLRAQQPKSTKRPRPNEPCWCGSGAKYKKCHRNADAAAGA